MDKVFCTKCGSQMNAGSKFCPVCGAPQEDSLPRRSASNPQPQPRPAKQKSAKPVPVKKLVTFAIVLAVCVSAAKVCERIFATPYLGAVSDYVKALSAEDFEDFAEIYKYSALSSDEDLDDYLDEHDYLEDTFDEFFDAKEDKYGENAKYSYKFKSVKPLLKSKQRLTEGSLKNGETVEEGVLVTVDLKVKGDKRSKDCEANFVVYKIDGEWYVTAVADDKMEGTPKVLDVY